MAARRKSGAEAEGAAEQVAPEAAVEPAGEVDEVEGDGEGGAAVLEVDEVEKVAGAHIAFMDGHGLVRYAPGDTIAAAHAARVTSAKALSK